MKKKLTLKKIKIAALNDREKSEIYGGYTGLCRTKGCTIVNRNTCHNCHY
jgi:hypothetical protein